MSEACPQAHIPPDLENLVQRLLAKEPAMRPKSAEALAGELAHLVEIGVANASGVRFSLARSLPPPPMAGEAGPPSSETLALAGMSGVPGSRLKWPLISVGTALVVVILGIVAFRGAGAAPTPSLAAAPIAPTAAPTAAAHDIPAPPPPESVPDIPTVSADELPRAPAPGAPARPSAGSGGRRPRGPSRGGQAASPGASPPAPGTPAPSGSTGYGYLE
jgi:hypothetical protein